VVHTLSCGKPHLGSRSYIDPLTSLKGKTNRTLSKNSGKRKLADQHEGPDVRIITFGQSLRVLKQQVSHQIDQSNGVA